MFLFVESPGSSNWLRRLRLSNKRTDRKSLPNTPTDSTITNTNSEPSRMKINFVNAQDSNSFSQMPCNCKVNHYY